MLTELAKALEESTTECMEDRIAISFSGGLDSATLAAIAKRHGEVFLFSAGVDGSEDLAYAQTVAGELGLPLEKIILDEAKVLEIYRRIYEFYPAGLLKIEIGVPIYACCARAAEAGYGAIMFGSGSEELFMGYERYYRYAAEGKNLDAIVKAEFEALGAGDIAMIRKIAYKCGLEARFPFYSRRLAELAFGIPLEERMADRELKKGVLREAGKLLGVPKTALERRKKAAQYGSGVHKIIMKNSPELNQKYPKKI
ncbi:MAG: asparagine synthase C-terminal domain-containing protein [Candidatus ainarchaeum sp.]|nr:asparagine synthase C-terminal domain-containing protein [Candidatus ainarchaeum sp.]